MATTLALPVSYGRIVRLPRWTLPWERTKEDAFVAAIAFTNATSGTSNTGATTLAATAANHTAGNGIVAVVAWSNNVNATIPTDTALNTYVSTGMKGSNGTTDHIEVFYAQNIAGNASNVVTAHFSASATFRRVIVYQFSGLSTTAMFTTGEGGSAAGATGTSIATGAWTPASANEVIVAGLGSSGTGSAITAGSGYTLQTNALGGDTSAEYEIVSAIASYTGSFSWTGSQTAWAAAASFKAAGAAPASLVTDTRRKQRNSLLRRHHDPRDRVSVYMNALRPGWRPRNSGLFVPEYA